VVVLKDIEHFQSGEQNLSSIPAIYTPRYFLNQTKCYLNSDY